MLGLKDHPQYNTPWRMMVLNHALTHPGRKKPNESAEQRNLRIIKSFKRKWDLEDEEAKQKQ